MDPARWAKMALQMRHTIPPLGRAGSVRLSQNTAYPTVCLMRLLPPGDTVVHVTSREELKQACSLVGGWSDSSHQEAICVGRPWRAQDIPDAGVDEVISSGTGQQDMEGEAVVQQLVVDKDPDAETVEKKIRGRCVQRPRY